MKSADDCIAVMAAVLLNKPEEEFDTLLKEIQIINDKKDRLGTTIDLKIRLNDKQSRIYETIKLLTISGDLKAIGMIFTDGMAVDTYVLLEALKIAMTMRGGLDDGPNEED